MEFQSYPPSETEKYLVRELIKLGLNPQPQYLVGKMHVDIAFPDEELVIEVNGPHHNSNEQNQRDIRRSIVAEKKGWIVKEYDADYNHMPKVAKDIEYNLKKIRLGEEITWHPKLLSNLEKCMDDNFKHLLNLIKTANKPLFITGKAGTGKSTLLKIFVKKTENVVVLAPTGIAAANIEGQTIHSFFRLPSGIVEKDIQDSISNEKLKLACTKMEYLVIDEISMVRADLFDVIDKILRNTRNSKSPFGGVKLILFGDLYQLPPVIKPRDKFNLEKDGYKIFHFFGSKVSSKLHLDVQNLTKVYRQADLDFIKLLDKARKGEIEQKDLEIFQPRTLDSPDKLDFPPMILTTTNNNVKIYNDSKLKDILRPFKIYNAEIRGHYKKNEMPVDPSLEIKNGARVMVTCNNGKTYVNGDLGTVVSWDSESVTVKIDRTGKNEKICPHIWDNFSFYYDSKIEKIRKILKGKFKQIPLKLGWAITIHKSQGLTLNNIYIDTEPGIWSAGQLYVALSRCPSLKGIHLKKVPELKEFIVDPVVTEFLTGFKGMPVTKPNYMEECKKTHPNAYSSWTEDEEKKLIDLFDKKISIKNISEILQRKPGGVRSRLKKLGKLNEEQKILK